MEPINQPILFLISLIANIFSAFSGGGAGLIQLPALIFLGLPFSAALATHKVASIALGLGATLRHVRERQLLYLYARLMLITGLPGVIIGTQIIQRVPDHAAKVALGVLTISLGVYSILNPKLGHEQNLIHTDRTGFLIGAAVLAIIGVLNGSLTSGTGLFATLWLVRWFGMDYKRAVAHTLVMVGLFWNGTGAVALGLAGNIEWSWLPALLLGSLLGGYIGAHLSIVKGNRWIKHAFEITALAIGIKLILG